MTELIDEPHNLQVIKTALRVNNINFAEVDPQVEGGWALEILDEVKGKALDDLVKVADTSQNVVITVAPNVGMIIATEGSA